jgi:glycosyltransferase involved in cell wall biosynthesis
LPDDWDVQNDPLSIIHLVAPGAVGGLESVVRALANGQRRRGHRVRVAAVLGAPGTPNPWLDQLTADGIEVIPIHMPGRQYLRERAAIAALCREIQPDVLHTHGYRPDVVGGSGARMAGVATVSTVHGFTGGGWKNRFYERIQCRALRSFDAVVSVAMPLAERLADAGIPRDRLHIIPNAYGGRTTFLPREEARKILGLAEGVRHVGWIGRLGREKGADVLIESLTRLAERDLLVSFIGEGRERRALERLVSTHDLESIVRFHGMVPDAARLIRAFDTVVLSSRTEGTPIVLLEAMAAGVPVIATRVGGIPDVVTEREALLVPPEQPDLLASALAATLRAPRSAAARAERALTRLATVGAVEPWLRRYDALYRTVRRVEEPVEQIAV